MLSEYIQSQYIVFSCGLARPALVITIAYLLLLAVIILYGTIKKDFKLDFPSVCKMKKGEKNKIFLSVIGFAVMVISCIVLPLLLDSENAIITISKVYLRYETIAFLGIFLFLASSFFIKTNREKQVIAANKIIKGLIWISIGTGIITSEIDYSYWPNIIIIISSWVLTGLFSIVDFEAVPKENEKNDIIDLIPYAPVESEKELFPHHKDQAEDIANIIINSSSNPFSVCVSGEWGMGKTSVMNGSIAILNDKHKNKYDFIMINALELDNKQAMIHYLFSQIKEKLQSRGVYVGIDSEIKDFISSCAGAVTSTSIGDLIHKNFFCENDDYRIQKEKLGEVINRAYGDGKLVVVVDDIERCDQEHARDYLFLIKEVATMKNCVSIFVTDYKMLRDIVHIDADQTSDEPDFLNKFFNYKIDLRDEPPQNIFKYYNSYFNSNDPASQSIYEFITMSPSTWCEQANAILRIKLQEQINSKNKYGLKNEEIQLWQEKILDSEARLALFQKMIKNSRNVAKFYNIFRYNTRVCSKLLFSLEDKEKTKKYIDTRNIGQVLYLISFVEAFLPIEFQRFIKKGADYVEHPPYDSNEVVTEERTLLIELTEGLVYGEYSEYQNVNVFIKQDTRAFIEKYLKNWREISELVNTFSSQEEKWLAAIEASNNQEIKGHWMEMVLMVLRKNPYLDPQITNQWRIETFSKLLKFAEQQVEMREWKSDQVFSILSSDFKTDRLFSIGAGMLTVLSEHLQSSKVYEKPSKDLLADIKMFPYHYTYDRMGYIYRLAHYLIPFENGNAQSKDLHEYMLNINRDYRDNISIFLDDLVRCIPNYSSTAQNWIEKYKELTKTIVDFLNEHNMVEYPDVKNEVEMMEDTITELLSLDSIITMLQDIDNNLSTLPSKFSSDNIDQVIQYFENAINSPDQYKENDVDKQFSDFFQWMRNDPNLLISEQQIEKLHELVTLHTNQMGYTSLPYRRLLLSLSSKQDEIKSSEEQ